MKVIRSSSGLLLVEELSVKILLGKTLAEYLRGGEEVPVRVDMDGEDWDTNFIAQLVDGDEGGDEDDMDVDEEPVSKFK